MPTATILYLGDPAPLGPLGSPFPGDAWQVRPAADAATALSLLRGGGADLLLIAAAAAGHEPADALTRLRAGAGAAGVAVVLLGPPLAAGPLDGLTRIAAAGAWRTELARCVEQARIDRQLDQFRALGGDEFVTEMIDLFLQQTPAQLGGLCAALGAADLRGVQRVAHSLKSSAGNFGARAIQELAYQAEQAAIQGDTDSVADRLGEIEQAYERARQYLATKKQGTAG